MYKLQKLTDMKSVCVCMCVFLKYIEFMWLRVSCHVSCMLLYIRLYGCTSSCVSACVFVSSLVCMNSHVCVNWCAFHWCVYAPACTVCVCVCVCEKAQSEACCSYISVQFVPDLKLKFHFQVVNCLPLRPLAHSELKFKLAWPCTTAL